MACAVAVAQTCPKAGDVEANLDEHLRLVRRARELDAELLVFPELSLTGYELGLADELAFGRDDARIAPLVAAAVDTTMTLLVGAPLRLESGLHIGAFILTPDAAEDVYTKKHLGTFPPPTIPGVEVPPPEPSVFVPGPLSPLLDFGDGVAAPAICADTSCASHAKDAAERGASAYLVGMFVIPDEVETIRARMARYAEQHAMIVAPPTTVQRLEAAPLQAAARSGRPVASSSSSFRVRARVLPSLSEARRDGRRGRRSYSLRAHAPVGTDS